MVGFIMGKAKNLPVWIYKESIVHVHCFDHQSQRNSDQRHSTGWKLWFYNNHDLPSVLCYSIHILEYNFIPNILADLLLQMKIFYKTRKWLVIAQSTTIEYKYISNIKISIISNSSWLKHGIEIS